jgi:hypothetical protein
MFASDMKPPIGLEVLTEINGPPFQHRFGDRWGPGIFRPPNEPVEKGGFEKAPYWRNS